jgi:hypothetical protein
MSAPSLGPIYWVRFTIGPGAGQKPAGNFVNDSMFKGNVAVSSIILDNVAMNTLITHDPILGDVNFTAIGGVGNTSVLDVYYYFT